MERFVYERKYRDAEGAAVGPGEAVKALIGWLRKFTGAGKGKGKEKAMGNGMGIGKGVEV